MTHNDFPCTPTENLVQRSTQRYYMYNMFMLNCHTLLLLFLFLLLEYETAHRRIMSYSFPGVPGLAAGGSGDHEKEREVRISSLIPMGSTYMVRINIHIVHVYTMQLCIASFQIWPNFPF